MRVHLSAHPAKPSRHRARCSLPRLRQPPPHSALLPKIPLPWGLSFCPGLFIPNVRPLSCLQDSH